MQKKTRKGKREKGELLTPKNMIKYSSDILKYKSYSNSSLWYSWTLLKWLNMHKIESEKLCLFCLPLYYIHILYTYIVIVREIRMNSKYVKITNVKNWIDVRTCL